MSYLTQIDTSTLANQNLSSALLVHTFTNTTRKRKIYISVDCDQIAGNGAYSVYATIQRAGAGSAFRAQPTTSATVASGVTSISFESIPLVVGATDVVKVYVTGLAGDTTTPDITTYIDEEFVLTDANGNVTFSNTSIATVTTLTNAPSDSSGVTTLLSRLSAARAGYLDNLNSFLDSATSAIKTVVDAIKAKTDNLPAAPSSLTAAQVDSQLSASHGAGLWGGAGGVGAASYVVTVDDGTNPLDGVEVWITTDVGGSNMVASGVTETDGEVTFLLDPGTYYLWKQLSGYNFTNPESITVV